MVSTTAVDVSFTDATLTDTTAVDTSPSASVRVWLNESLPVKLAARCG